MKSVLHTPMDVVEQFPERKSKLQKQNFREAVCAYASGLGYPVTVEQGPFFCRNVVMGDPETACFLVTAHYDTCAGIPIPNPVNSSNHNDNTSGVVTVLEMMRTLPENQRNKVCFVLFDLKNAGLIGSSAYRKAHQKATNTQMVLNLDCVGNGDHLRMFPTKALKKDRRRLTSLYKACGYFGKKELLVHEKGFGIFPSDQIRFPYGVGICALKSNKWGLYLDRFHTKKNTILEHTNVNLLRAALSTYISQTEVSL